MENRTTQAPKPKKRNTTWLYVVIFVVVSTALILHEWQWRYDSPFKYVAERQLLWGPNSEKRMVHIEQFTLTPVDSSRREFKDPRNGVTDVTIWQLGRADTLRFKARGHYYSGFLPAKFTNDGSAQIFLIPNTEQDLALGVGELIYLDSAQKLAVQHIESTNVGDADKDGVFEIYDRSLGTFEHLDPMQGKWIPVVIKPAPKQE